MSHDQNSLPAQDEPWAVATPDQLSVVRMVRRRPERVLSWDATLTDEQRVQIRSLQILQSISQQRALPAFFITLLDLEELSLPLHHAPQLFRDVPLSKLRSLTFLGEGKLDLPKSVSLPALQKLSLGGAKVQFSANFAPNISYLSIDDLSKRNLKELGALESLRRLSAPLNNDALPALPVHLEALERCSQKLRDFEGIQHLTGLRELYTKGARSLRSIAALRSLQRLEKLTIMDAQQLEDPEVVLDLPALRELKIVVASAAWARVEERLRRLKLDHLTIF